MVVETYTMPQLLYMWVRSVEVRQINARSDLLYGIIAAGAVISKKGHSSAQRALKRLARSPWVRDGIGKDDLDDLEQLVLLGVQPVEEELDQDGNPNDSD